MDEICPPQPIPQELPSELTKEINDSLKVLGDLANDSLDKTSLVSCNKHKRKKY